MEHHGNFGIDPTALVRRHHLDNVPTMSPAGTGEQGLGAKLKDAIQHHSKSSPTSKPYIPISELNSLITPEAIDKDLQDVPGLTDSQRSLIIVPQTSTSYVKVFAVLALIGKQASIIDFINANANDKILPITTSDHVEGSLPLVFCDNRTATPLDCFSDWTVEEITAFEENQWLTQSPVFLPPSGATLTQFLQLHAKTPLPWVEDSSAKIPDRFGGSSTVTRINIHPAHNNLGKSQEAKSYAVKRLSASRKHEWAREIEMLKTFTEQPSSNLMPLMAAWQQDDSFYLLFPWAKTDLRSWWRSNPDPLTRKDPFHSEWLASLCLDVSAGLEAFHKGMPGYHGDIKPENILWFPDSDNKTTGKWKIADFGLSHLGDKADGSKALERFGCTPGYRAPEYDEKNMPMGQKADVWSLACVFIEAAIWCYMGMKGLRNFEAERFLDEAGGKNGDGAFWEVKSGQAELKPLVQRWLSDLDDTCQGRFISDSYRSNLVSICRNDMLVPDSVDRKPIFDVAPKLRTMHRSSTDSSPELAAIPDSSAAPLFDLADLNSAPTTNYMTDISSLPLHSSDMTSDLAWTNNFNSVFSYPTNAAQQYFTAPEPALSPSSLLPPTQSSGSPTFSDEKDSPRDYHTLPVEKAPSLSKGKKRAAEGIYGVKDRSTGKSRKTEQTLRFACPYHKFDPATYGIHDSRWRTCVGPGWTSVHRVKEHIDRKHSIPPNTCMRCLNSFARPADLRDHQRAEPPCQVPADGFADHRITEAQRSQMRRRPKGRSDVDAWNDIYRIVFGLSEDDPVPSPYCEQNVEGSPSAGSGSPATPIQQESSMFRFEEYLRNTLLPSANEEVASKIMAYFDLAEMYRSHEAGIAPAMGTAVSMSSVPSGLTSQPNAGNYMSALSSMPSLVPDDGRMMSSSDLYSTVATMGGSEMPPPSLDGARSKLGIGQFSSMDAACAAGLGGGAGGALPKRANRMDDLNFMCGWDPSTLSQEEEDFSRMLFDDLNGENQRGSMRMDGFA